MEDFAGKPKVAKKQPRAKTKSKQLELPIPKENVNNNNNNANNENNNNINELPSLPPLPKKLKQLPNLPGQSFSLGFRNPHGSRNRDQHDILWDFVLSLDQNPVSNLILKMTLCDACKGRVEPYDTRAILPCGHTYHANCVPNEVDPQCSACTMPKKPSKTRKQKAKQKPPPQDVQMEEITLEFIDGNAMDEDMLPELPELPEIAEPLPVDTDSKKKPTKKRKKKTTKTRKSKRAKSKSKKPA